MSQDPERLFESPDAPAELRADLEQAREDDPARYDVAAGLAAFEASMAAPPPGVEAAAGGSKALTWVIVAVVGAATAGAVAWAVTRGDDDPKPRRELGQAAEMEPDRPKSDRLEPATNGSDRLEPAEPATNGSERRESASGVPDPGPNPEPHPDSTRPPNADSPPKRPRPRPDKPAPADPDPNRLAAEMKLTSAAKSALNGNPKRALQLAKKGNAEFPKGLFRQDRQAIIVLALFALGRTAEAEKKAKTYLRRYPKGSFAAKVRAKLADKKTEG